MVSLLYRLVSSENEVDGSTDCFHGLSTVIGLVKALW